MISCQVLVDPPEEGAWNMALDEALLLRAADEGIATLRCYQWREPTLSLGYFQRLADRQQHPPSSSAPLVRRQSGGGAILHDRELTYSLALPSAHPLAIRAQELYRVTHRLIISLLDASRRSEASIGQLDLAEAKTNGNTDTQPFLCFQRRSSGDIILREMSLEQREANHKLVGSAQRRRRGAVLQHGSILLDRSQLAPELPGWNDLLHETLTPELLAARLVRDLPKALALETFKAKLPDELRETASEIVRSKYACDTWNHRR